MRAICALLLLCAAALGHPPYNIAADAKGNVYFLDWPRKKVMKAALDGKVTEFADLNAVAKTTDPHTLAIDAKGNLLVSATYEGRMWKISPKGRIEEVKLGKKVLGNAAILNLTLGPTGDLHLIARHFDVAADGRVVDRDWRILRIPSKGEVRELFRSRNVDLYAGSLTVAKDGTVYVTNENRVLKLAKGELVPVAGRLEGPYGLCVDGEGDLLVAELDGHRIRKVTPKGEATVFAGTGKRGHEDGPARKARFDRPYAVCTGPGGRIYVAEYSSGPKHHIRLIEKGVVRTLATLPAR